ncbi:MAG: NAD-dependent epimerase/dehydratase family protein [Candidatus Taylorbacteria bacterium]|nr:NAD-dependent epimerase/dehydratase family protein [Candidatus Taylorbacteria bacterium]
MNELATIIKNDVLEILPKIDFRELDGKTILLTGASGLIGTYFLATLRELRNKGVKMDIVAVVQNKFPEYLSYFGENVGFVQGDLTNAKLMASLPQADYIIHAAGYGQPGKFLENPLKTMGLNTTVTIALFQKLKKGGKFLFMSTSEVYSGLETTPYGEDMIGTTNTAHPRACYIEGKRCGEAIVNAERAQAVDAKSARLSLAYGPGTKPGDKRVINAFIEKALRGKLTLLDHGEVKRTYCYVSDAVEILWRILLFGKEPIYNVGGAGTITIADLAKKIGKLLKVPVVFPAVSRSENLGAGAPLDTQLDMTRVKNEFKKTDYVPLDEGLSRTVEWQKILYERIENRE